MREAAQRGIKILEPHSQPLSINGEGSNFFFFAPLSIYGEGLGVRLTFIGMTIQTFYDCIKK